MPGLDPGIHAKAPLPQGLSMDGRVKPSHDDTGACTRASVSASRTLAMEYGTPG
jgi:hypothetical protein